MILNTLHGDGWIWFCDTVIGGTAEGHLFKMALVCGKSCTQEVFLKIYIIPTAPYCKIICWQLSASFWQTVSHLLSHHPIWNNPCTGYLLWVSCSWGMWKWWVSIDNPEKLVTFQGRCGENQIATGSIAAACKTISAKFLKIKRNYMWIIFHTWIRFNMSIMPVPL